MLGISSTVTPAGPCMRDLAHIFHSSPPNSQDSHTRAPGVEPTHSARILIADRYDVVRCGLRTILEKRNGWQVVAEASDHKAAIDQAIEAGPDVAIIDALPSRLITSGVSSLCICLGPTPGSPVAAESR